MTRCGCSDPGVLGCLCELISSSCIAVSGTGESSTPYSLSPILSGAANQLLSCGTSGLVLDVSDKPIARKVTRESWQSISNNTITPITFTFSPWASSAVSMEWSPGVNPTRLTVPADGEGRYVFTGQMGYDSGTTGGVRRALLRVNGTSSVVESGVPGRSGRFEGLNLCTVLDLVAGDFLELCGFQDSGGTVRLSGRLVGVRLTR